MGKKKNAKKKSSPKKQVVNVPAENRGMPPIKLQYVVIFAAMAILFWMLSKDLGLDRGTRVRIIAFLAMLVLGVPALFAQYGRDAFSASKGNPKNQIEMSLYFILMISLTGRILGNEQFSVPMPVAIVVAIVQIAFLIYMITRYTHKMDSQEKVLYRSSFMMRLFFAVFFVLFLLVEIFRP